MTKVPFIHENPCKEGMMARTAGLRITDNPYTDTGYGALPNSYALWKEGWHERDAELPKQKKKRTKSV